jgi:hypothetical protein
MNRDIRNEVELSKIQRKGRLKFCEMVVKSKGVERVSQNGQL